MNKYEGNVDNPMPHIRFLTIRISGPVGPAVAPNARCVPSAGCFIIVIGCRRRRRSTIGRSINIDAGRRRKSRLRIFFQLISINVIALYCCNAGTNSDYH